MNYLETNKNSLKNTKKILNLVMSRHRVMSGHVIFKFSGNIEHNILFFTLLGFLCSYRGMYSIFPSNQFPFNNPL
jgi:hypothetical protein